MILDFVFDVFVLYINSTFFENWFFLIFCIFFVSFVPAILRRFFVWG